MVDNLAEGEGVDYEINTITNDRNSRRGPKRRDWLLTVDLAKKLHKFMVSRLDLDTGLNVCSPLGAQMALRRVRTMKSC